MNWAAVVAAILQLVGPVLADFLKHLLDRMLSQAAARMPGEPAGPGSVAGLFDAAESRLPWLAVGRRILLRAVRRIAVGRADAILSGVALSPLVADELHELKLVALAAEHDLLGAA